MRILFMEKNNTEVIFQIRSSDDRRRVEDRRFYTRHEDLEHDPARIGNKIKRRMLGDRRRVLPEIISTFWKEAR
jgi:hypothetical protein